MRPEVRDEFLRLGDEVARTLGGSSFDEGLTLANALVSKLSEIISGVKTRELLIRELDAAELTPQAEQLLLCALTVAPELLRFGLSELSKRAAETLPASKQRRPSVPAGTQTEMIRYMEYLYIEKKIPLAVAKQRTASKFMWKLRTVERYWKQRDKILGSGPEMRLNDVVASLKAALAADMKAGISLL
jgi:hypothetical protein